MGQTPRGLIKRLFLLIACVGILAACGNSDSETTAQTDKGKQTAPVADGQATIHTNLGDITVNLFAEQAPETVANFRGLADGSKSWDGQEGDKPLYDNVIFHRVIAGFMIQGGDPEGTGMGGPGYQFEDEVDSDLSFDRPYLLAMANSGPNTNGSQFFITVAPTPHLTGMHTIFGEVADDESKKVVDKIANVQTGEMDKPVDDVVITSVSIAD